MNKYLKTLIVAALTLLVALPAAAGISGKYSTVNSSIRLGENATAGDVDSVNGSIRIGAGSSVASVDTVNGSIELGNDVAVDGNVETVNGSIELNPGCEVGGGVETVNGGIRMDNTRVANNIETVNGRLRILDRSEVFGDVAVRKPGGWGFSHRQKPVQVEIGENVVVHGKLLFEQPVELTLHDSAKVGEIVGEYVQGK